MMESIEIAWQGCRVRVAPDSVTVRYKTSCALTDHIGQTFLQKFTNLQL